MVNAGAWDRLRAAYSGQVLPVVFDEDEGRWQFVIVARGGTPVCSSPITANASALLPLFDVACEHLAVDIGLGGLHLEFAGEMPAEARQQCVRTVSAWWPQAIWAVPFPGGQ